MGHIIGETFLHNAKDSKFDLVYTYFCTAIANINTFTPSTWKPHFSAKLIYFVTIKATYKYLPNILMCNLFPFFLICAPTKILSQPSHGNSVNSQAFIMELVNHAKKSKETYLFFRIKLRKQGHSIIKSGTKASILIV